MLDYIKLEILIFNKKKLHRLVKRPTLATSAVITDNVVI
jgi:hypothetical protein